jgi:hypothetical protein
MLEEAPRDWRSALGLETPGLEVLLANHLTETRAVEGYSACRAALDVLGRLGPKATPALPDLVAFQQRPVPPPMRLRVVEALIYRPAPSAPPPAPRRAHASAPKPPLAAPRPQVDVSLAGERPGSLRRTSTAFGSSARTAAAGSVDQTHGPGLERAAGGS